MLLDFCICEMLESPIYIAFKDVQMITFLKIQNVMMRNAEERGKSALSVKSPKAFIDRGFADISISYNKLFSRI